MGTVKDMAAALKPLLSHPKKRVLSASKAIFSVLEQNRPPWHWPWSWCQEMLSNQVQAVGEEGSISFLLSYLAGKGVLHT